MYAFCRIEHFVICICLFISTMHRFKSKYHPEECDKRRVTLKAALETRRKVFDTLREKKYFEEIFVDAVSTDSLVKIMDASKKRLDKIHTRTFENCI